MSDLSKDAMAQREIEDLWWLRHSLEALVEGQPDGHLLRVGLLRGILTTTEPETAITDPAPPAADPPPQAAGEGGGLG